MLRIRTQLKINSKNKIGLFSDETISKGQCIWEFDSDFDRIYYSEFIEKLNEANKEFFSQNLILMDDGRYLFCCDDMRFINYSISNNVQEDTSFRSKSIANKDIEIGEELTTNVKML